MRKVSTWQTPKGSAVELVTEHITKETIYADGWNHEVDADHIHIHSLTINGEEKPAGLWEYKGQKVIHMGERVINGTRHPLLRAIPEDGYADVWGEYDARQKAKRDAERAEIQKEQAEIAKKAKQGLCPKCGTYCYGDCDY